MQRMQKWWNSLWASPDVKEPLIKKKTHDEKIDEAQLNTRMKKLNSDLENLFEELKKNEVTKLGSYYAATIFDKITSWPKDINKTLTSSNPQSEDLKINMVNVRDQLEKYPQNAKYNELKAELDKYINYKPQARYGS